MTVIGAGSQPEQTQQPPRLPPLKTSAAATGSGSTPAAHLASELPARVQERLAAEVLRKLGLAAEAERREDRDIICSEVFADVTGELNRAARESAGHLYARWYEALAPYFCRNRDASDTLLAACRRLWGQPFTAPTYALLLHQWLLVHPDAGGRDQRQKHLAVLVSGARQLFIGDVETASSAFQPLYAFIAEQVVLPEERRRLAALPSPARESIMALAASFLPYYMPPPATMPALLRFPNPRALMGSGGGRGSMSSAGGGNAAGRGGGVAAGSGSTAVRPHLEGEGADFVIACVADTLSKDIRTEAGQLRYLATLSSLRGAPCMALLRATTKLRLQHMLYTLMQPGGFSRAPRSVNRAAAATLDALFPAGRRTRRLISFIFRLVNPHEWAWLPVWHAVAAGARRALAAIVSGWLWLIAAISVLVATLRRQ